MKTKCLNVLVGGYCHLQPVSRYCSDYNLSHIHALPQSIPQIHSLLGYEFMYDLVSMNYMGHEFKVYCYGCGENEIKEALEVGELVESSK